MAATNLEMKFYYSLFHDTVTEIGNMVNNDSVTEQAMEDLTVDFAKFYVSLVTHQKEPRM
jgi:CheY-specific phosphatase CheX